MIGRKLCIPPTHRQPPLPHIFGEILGGFPSSHIVILKTSTFDFISYLLIASPWLEYLLKHFLSVFGRLRWCNDDDHNYDDNDDDYNDDNDDDNDDDDNDPVRVAGGGVA